MNINLENNFRSTVEYIRSLPSEGPLHEYHESRAILYGLYKRITVGKCSEKGGEQPSMIDIIPWIKWKYWNQCNTMDINESMIKYISIVEELKKEFIKN